MVTEITEVIETVEKEEEVVQTGKKSKKRKDTKTTTVTPTATTTTTADSVSVPVSSSGSVKDKDSNVEMIEEITVTHYDPLNPGPYPADQPPQNTVRFTPVQIEAVRSGLNVGLTMVVGPPGTGKTDVAVQIISALYHNNPTQKILLVTHSNAALNDLFEKIMERNVDARHSKQHYYESLIIFSVLDYCDIKLI